MKTDLSLKDRWILAWLVLLGIVCLFSVVPAFSPPDVIDELLHFGCFFLLTSIPLARVRRRIVAFVFVGCMPTLGLLLEYLQRNIHGRTFSAEDMLANNIGAAAGIVVGILFRLVTKRNQVQGERND